MFIKRKDKKEQSPSRRKFKRKLSRYRHTRSYNRISGGGPEMLSFTQGRNRKLLILTAAAIIIIGLVSVILDF